MPEFSKPKAIVLDIEGTICDTAFVKDKLSPNLVTKIGQFFNENYEKNEVKFWIQKLRSSKDVPAAIVIPEMTAGKERVVPVLINTLQHFFIVNYHGVLIRELHILMWIWFYRTNLLIGHVYDEVTTKLHCWKFEDEIKICLFSSSTVIAQKLMIVRTNCGNCLPLIDHYITSKFGQKNEKQSYINISDGLNIPVNSILFISDNVNEVNAASNAGLNVALIFRENNEVPLKGDPLPKVVKIKSFDDVVFK